MVLMVYIKYLPVDVSDERNPDLVQQSGEYGNSRKMHKVIGVCLLKEGLLLYTLLF